MLKKNAFLSPKTLADDVLMRATRDGFGDGLLEAGASNSDVVVLCADLSESTRTQAFRDRFPAQYVQMGVSEQALAAIATGMALQGKIPFIASYAAFSPGRNWEQIRTLGALQHTNLKIAGAHAGVSVGPDGATHQMTEDIALMRVIPNMTVLVPCDAEETRKAVHAAIAIDGPVYIRFAREKSAAFTTAKTPFTVGRALELTSGNDVAIIACGPLVHEALKAAKMLEKDGIEARVINCPSIKPLDEPTVVKAAQNCGAVVTVEEAQIAGGLGGAIAELLAREAPTPVEFVGMHDTFGQSGEPQELLEHYKLTAPWIAKAAKRVLKKKG